MKGMLTKSMRSVLALLLVGCMMFGLCSTVVAAETDSGLNEQVTGLLKELETLLEEYGPKVLDTAFTYYKADTAALRAEAKELIAKLEEKLKSYTADEVEALKDAIADIKADLKAKKAQMEGMVDDLKAEMAEMEELLANAQGATVMAVATEDKVDAAINDLKAAIEDIKAEIADYEKAINDAVAKAEAEIEKMEENLGKVFTDLGALRDILDQLKAAMNKAEDFTGENYDEDIEAAVELMKKAIEDVAGLVGDIKNGTVNVDEAVNICDEALRGLVANAEAYLKNQYKAISNAADKLMDQMIGEFEEKFEDKVDLLKQRADDLEAAALAEFDEKIEEAKADAEAEIAELEALYGAAAADQIAELRAELEAEVAALKAQAAEEAAAARADMDAIINQIPAKIAEAKASAQDMIDDLENSAKKLYAKAEAKAKELYEQLPALYGEIKEMAQPYIEKFEAAYEEATTDDYEIKNASYYVAIGDDAAMSESYVDGLAEYLDIDYKNLAEVELTAKEAVAVVKENADEIAKADLITVGFSSATLMTLAIDNEKDLDWAAHLGAEGAEKVEKVLSELRAELEKIDQDLVETLGDTLESYAYYCLSYAVYLPAVVDEIRQINPDAVVAIVGMYNELDGVSVEYGSRTVDVGKYFGYAVDISSLHALVYAMVTHNAIFVEASEAETMNTTSVMKPTQLLMAYGKGKMYPSEAGYEYIKMQVINALRITRRGLWGDANSDGQVLANDALLVLQYSAGLITRDQLDLSVCDVNGDGGEWANDALLILQRSAGQISKFPVE